MNAQDILSLVQKNASTITALTGSDSRIDSVINLIKANSSSSGLAGIVSAVAGIFGKNKNTDISSLVTLALSQLKGTDLAKFDISSVASVLKNNTSAANVISSIVNIIK